MVQVSRVAPSTSARGDTEARIPVFTQNSGNIETLSVLFQCVSISPRQNPWTDNFLELHPLCCAETLCAHVLLHI